MKKYYKLADNVATRVYEKSSCESCCEDVRNIILFDYQREPFEDDDYDTMYCYTCYANTHADLININHEEMRKLVIDYVKKVPELKNEVIGIETADNDIIESIFDKIGWQSCSDTIYEDEDYYDED